MASVAHERRPNVSLIWRANQIGQIGLGPWIAQTGKASACPPDLFLAQTKPLSSRLAAPGARAPIPFSQRLPPGGPRRRRAVKALTRLLRSRCGPSGDCAASTRRRSHHGLRRHDPALCAGIARRSPWCKRSRAIRPARFAKRICLRAQTLTRNSPCERGRWPGGPDGVRKAGMVVESPRRRSCNPTQVAAAGHTPSGASRHLPQQSWRRGSRCGVGRPSRAPRGVQFPAALSRALLGRCVDHGRRSRNASTPPL